MLSGALVILLIAGVFSRPDVSHLKGIKQYASSYDVPVGSVDNEYVKTTHVFHQDVPTVRYLRPFVYGQGAGNQNVYYVSKAGEQHLVPITVTGGQVSSSSHGLENQGNNAYYTLQSGEQYLIPITLSGGSSSSSHGLQNQGNVQYVYQGLGQGNAQHTSQGINLASRGDYGGVNFVTHGGHGGVNFVSQGGQSHSHAGSGNAARVVENKERVYFFSAPEDAVEHHTRLRINIVPTHTKNSNVIFVKAPSVGKIIPEVVVPSHQVVEDKTKVVVLVKENDHFVPLKINAPIPISQGKAEVVVVKYHDKNDKARVVSGGHIGGSTLIGQDKTSFIHGNVGSLTSRFDSSGSNAASVNVAGGASGSSSGGSAQTLHAVGGGAEGQGVVNSNVETQYQVLQGATGDQSSNQGNSGHSYQIKTVEVTGQAPSVSSGAQFISGGDQQAAFGVTYSGGSSGTGYTLESSDYTQGGSSLDFGSLDNVKKLLGDGVEIVSVNKGTLHASGVGGNAKNTIFKSLGISDDVLQQGVGAVSHSVSGGQLSDEQVSGQSSYQSSSTGGSHQIQIGQDVADVISGSSLKA
ncbi:hypothetical protein PPYR_09935 [Photinus pyralis]|uniref:DUF243 domain-containing protein n=2 Tax=Photinus pyralis TaxID=7054 RepID=A0A5N4AEY5_PHOPY|nr:uncharacterized protein LOC116174020 [Photinus pyralis]KAB0795874.1 hypothetical protein PPYR_09935 [Photinus pyralis]